MSAGLPEGGGEPPLSNRWGHPFTPYPIQEAFMREAFDTLDKGGIGIFESPTGTGKSLSLICASLTWLNAHLSGELDDPADRADARAAPAEASGARPASPAEPDWIEEASRDLKRQQRQSDFMLAAEQRQKRLKRLQSGRSVLGATQAWRAGGAPAPAGAEAAELAGGEGEDAMASFLVQDDAPAGHVPARPFEASDEEEAGGGAAGCLAARARAPSGTPPGAAADELAPVRPAVQVIYCSRTHSQLAQFVGEVRRTKFAASLSTVSLGARKQLCAHAPVARLGSAARVNDGCQALQRSKGAGCPKLHPRTAPAQAALRDRLLTAPLEVEELHALGSALGCCPYYTARSAAAGAHVLLVPYSCLLHEQTREALGIRLSSSVVILDEAHNLLEALNDVHSVCLSHGQLCAAWGQLCRYHGKYERQLSGSNRSCLTRLLRFVKALREAVAPAGQAAASSAPPAHGGRPPPHRAPGGGGGSALAGGAPPGPASAACSVLGLSAFLAGCRIDHLNLWELATFCQRTELARKVQGFVDAADASEAADAGIAACEQRGGGGASAAATYGVIAMLRALTSSDLDGRVLVQRAAPSGAGAGGCAEPGVEGSVKYLHLNPSVHLAPIVAQARALILAGGTMEPRDELVSALLAGAAEPGRLRCHTFGHVVPPAHLLGLCVKAGGAGEPPLQLTASERGKEAVLDSICSALGHVRRSCPGGMIVFFPSFAYLRTARQRWERTGGLQRALGGSGPIFEEPREASELERALTAYAAAIRGTDGTAEADGQVQEGAGAQAEAERALRAAPAGGEPAGAPGAPGRATLLAVVGGKMSEGINFADELGRCVVLIGLPYPNPRDPELVERMAFLNKSAQAAPGPASGSGSGGSGSGGTPAQRYYEGLCMRAVNQSIGRVIRHAADYAAIVLLDARYASERVQGKLPGWIRASLHTVGTAPEAAAAMSAFFQQHSARCKG